MENLHFTAPGFKHLTEMLRISVILDLLKYGSELETPSSFTFKVLLVVSLVGNVIDGDIFL